MSERETTTVHPSPIDALLVDPTRATRTEPDQGAPHVEGATDDGLPDARPLRDVRIEQKWTTRDLARAAGVTANTVYLTEVGRTLPRFAAIRRISGVLGVRPKEILEFKRAVAARAK